MDECNFLNFIHFLNFSPSSSVKKQIGSFGLNIMKRIVDCFPVTETYSSFFFSIGNSLCRWEAVGFLKSPVFDL